MKSAIRTGSRALGGQIVATFLLAAASGIAWNLYRRRWPSTQLIDWQRVRLLAQALSGGNRPLAAEERIEREAAYQLIVQRVSPPMIDYLGPGQGRQFAFQAFPRAIDRHEWIEVNIQNFKEVFEPVECLLRERFGNHFSQPLNALSSSVFLGILLGYLSRRVLGQYDPALMLKEPLAEGKLFLVEPNLREACRQLEVPNEQFETWIVFHELTHSWQFEAHPWLRDFMNTQVRELITTATANLSDMDAMELLRLAMRGELDIRRPHTMLSAVMSSEQRHRFERLQALMCLLEGFSNHVMNVIGPKMLPDYEEISRRFEGRQRQKTPAEQLFLRLSGLEVKLEQYRAGEAFVAWIVGRGGPTFINRAWECAENLPSLKEIYSPDRWIARMGQAPALTIKS